MKPLPNLINPLLTEDTSPLLYLRYAEFGMKMCSDFPVRCYRVHDNLIFVVDLILWHLTELLDDSHHTAVREVVWHGQVSISFLQ